MGAATGTGDLGGPPTGPTVSSVSCKLVIGDLLKELIYFEVLKT